MNKFPLMIGCFVFLTCACVHADNAPATIPSSQPTVISSGDASALSANTDKPAIVQGTVSEAEWSPSGKVFFIRFTDGDTSQFQGVIFAPNRTAMEKAFDGDLGKALLGAKIQITGSLKTYRERPEIIVDKPDQIAILEKPPEPATQASSTTQPTNGN